MSLSATLTSDLGDLSLSFGRKLVLPEDERFDEARRAWNLAVDQRPAAVVFPESAQDVVAAVTLARESGGQVAAQGTGHNAGPLGSLENTILLRTERMRDVVIDPATRVARVGAGVLAAELVLAAARHGLGAVAGTSPDVGVVGYSLGGGIGVLSRRFGLAANHVRAFEVVTADGQLVRTDREHEPDLFWALRGGGGSFGVVTAMELELLPITRVYAGTLWYAIERASEVLEAWRELTESDPPDELGTIGRIMHFPPLPDFPEALRGKSFVLVHVYHAADRAQADRRLAPLRALGPVNDTVDTVMLPALTAVHMDPERPAPVAGDGLMVAELPSAALETFVEVAVDSGLLTVELRHLEGELARPRPENGALASIAAKHVLYAGGIAPTPELVSAAHQQIEAITQALAPWAASYITPNFAETGRDAPTLWPESAYRRLRQIKGTVDPDNVIQANHPIAPRS
jgi:FAD/FMN-containing dehydrogenase